MAAVSECFSIGSTVACTTCFNQNIEGEVLAFDPNTKMLILSILLQHKQREKFENKSKFCGAEILERISMPFRLIVFTRQTNSFRLS